MEPESSLPLSHQPSTCPFAEPLQSSPFFPILFFKIHSSIVLSSVVRPSCWSLSYMFRHQNLCILILCFTFLLLLHFMTRIIFSEKYILRSSPLCSLLYPSVTSSLLGTNIFLSTLYSNILSLYSPF
jgi:hypothetical protein